MSVYFDFWLACLLSLCSCYYFDKLGHFKNANALREHHYPAIIEDSTDPHDHYTIIKDWFACLHDKNGNVILDCNNEGSCFRRVNTNKDGSQTITTQVMGANKDGMGGAFARMCAEVGVPGDFIV